jgi:hypothetical protein
MREQQFIYKGLYLEKVTWQGGGGDINTELQFLLSSVTAVTKKHNWWSSVEVYRKFQRKYCSNVKNKYPARYKCLEFCLCLAGYILFTY